MSNYLKYLICIFLLIGCFTINKPFENSKITTPFHNSLNSTIYIDDIIGVSHDLNLSLKNKIYNKLIKKNILASYEYYNENSYFLKSTLIKYHTDNKIKIIFNISNPKEDNIHKIKILLPNENLDNLKIQNTISNNTAAFIEKIYFKLNKIRYLKIDEINGLKKDKNLKNIFYKKLEEIYSLNSFKIVNNKNFNVLDTNSVFSLKIDFDFTDVDKEKVKVKIIWYIFDNKDQLLGTIVQENIIKKSIISYVWDEISNKIIEMSVTELNMLINL